MNKNLRNSLLLGTVLVIVACNWGVTPTPVPLMTATPPLSLVVQVQNPGNSYDSVGDVINYSYTITNTGTQALAGPITVNDSAAAVTCPELNTVGNNNNSLDPGEFITCSGIHTVMQADIDARKVASVVTASAAGGSITSAPGGVTVNMTVGALGLDKTASALTYNQAGQVITYTYIITNTGTLAVGPTQFMITDDHIGAGVPFACGENGRTLNPGENVSCTANYTITQQDMGVSSVKNTATASGGSAQASSPISVTINNSTFQSTIIPGSSNFTAGTTIQHQVVKGEWLFQIARCYGVSYTSLRNANLSIPNPSRIDPGLVVTVPNIGSAGTIYGPPCVVFHTVVAGDTWNSIATRYNAKLDVLQEVNPSGLVTGAQIKVPINSAGGSAVYVPVTGGPTSTTIPATATATPTATATVTPTATPTVTATVTSMVTTIATGTPTVTATAGTTTPGVGQPNRITFPAGSTSVSVSQTLISRATVSYVVAALQGQTMTVSLSASAIDIATRIHEPSGLIIKPLDGNLTWTGLIPTTGDYRIDLVGLTDGNKNYILTVTVTSP